MPELTSITVILLACSAFLAGFIDSIAGGGGIITVPALLWAGFPPHLALGTNKLQSSFGSFTASMNYARNRLVDFREIFTGIIMTILGASCGTLTVQILSAEILSRLIPALLIGVFLYILFSPDTGIKRRTSRIAPGAFYITFGLCIGFYDGFFGPGTGSLWTLAFVLFRGFDFRSGAAYTKVVNFTSNIVALAWFFYGGNVVVGIGLIMGICQVLGAFTGSGMVIRRGARFVRVFFLMVVAATLIHLIYDNYIR